MPFVLILAGVVLIISAVRNTQQQLFYLLALDFTGPNNFVYWFLSILVIGAIGYVPKLKPLSDGFLILVILVLFLKKGKPGAGGGFFEAFQRGIGSTTAATPKVSTGTGGSSSSISIPGVITSFDGSGGGLTNSSGGSIGGGIGGGLYGPSGPPFGCDPFWDPWCITGGGGGIGGGKSLPSPFPL